MSRTQLPPCEEVAKSWGGGPATYIDAFNTERCRRCQEPVEGHPGAAPRHNTK